MPKKSADQKLRIFALCVKFIARMKRFLKTLIINGFIFWLLERFYPAITLQNFRTLILATLALTLANILIRPLIKLITLPLNFLTLGFFSWAANIATFYITVWIVEGFSLSTTYFPGFQINGIKLQSTELPRIATLVIATFAFSFLNRLLTWLFAK